MIYSTTDYPEAPLPEGLRAAKTAAERLAWIIKAALFLRCEINQPGEDGCCFCIQRNEHGVAFWMNRQPMEVAG